MKKEDLKTGELFKFFKCSNNAWICTDIDSKIIIAIDVSYIYDSYNKDTDEYDFEVCSK